MNPHTLHNQSSMRNNRFTSVKDLTHAANYAFEQNQYHEKENIESSKKRKYSVSSMVDDIFSEIDESFFLQNKQPKFRRSMSRAKSFRSLKNSFTTSGEKSVNYESETSSTESMSCVSPQSIDHGIFESGHESALNIYHKLFFPALPPTVSALSCNGTSSVCSNYGHIPADVKLNRQVSLNEDAPMIPNAFSKLESENNSPYGWFVATDDDKEPSGPNSGFRGHLVSPLDDLAFKAPTAPKRVDDNAELEWACAADTVDDVLGDLF